MSEVATKDAYAQGVDAGMRGFAASDNPYDPVEEHDAYAAMEAPPISGPLPAPNMGKVATPMLNAPPAATPAPAAVQ